MPETISIYIGAAMLALGNGIMWPSVISLLSKHAGDRYQGAVQGFAGSCGAVASTLGLLAGGSLLDFMGSLVFWISAALICVVFIMTVSVHMGPKQTALQ